MSVSERIEKWKQKLLDLGKRNRLLNYKETKRSNIVIVKPDIDEIYNLLVNKAKTLEFVTIDENINYLNYDLIDKSDVKYDIKNFEIKKGQILTNRPDSEMFKTLERIRSKARTVMAEQGINILYLAFGFIKWKDIDNSQVFFKSPIVLVPVELTLESPLDHYKISLANDDIVVNPTLLFKLERDFNIKLPELEVDGEINILDYLDQIEKVIPKEWSVIKEVHLSLFSFLKLNMYEDLDRHTDKISSHPFIKTLAGDRSNLKQIPEELKSVYDHDSKIKPIDTFQVVDADASQQDAIIAAKKGVSFVLQGPPGTGKSQTITNIIAECLAEGKKVLFVSEKVAALEVVYKRLKEVGLTDFCLQLHSHKANKKDVLQDLGRTLHKSKSRIKDEDIVKLYMFLKGFMIEVVPEAIK